MKNGNQSRASQALSDLIKAKLFNGETPVGSLLPSIRTLTTTYQYSLKTVHRALHILVSDGYLAAEPYRGYRVLPLVNDPDANSPLVFLMAENKKEGRLTNNFQSFFEEIKNASAKKGWSILIISSFGKSNDAIIKQIQTARAFGIIAEGCSASLAQDIRNIKIPIISIDTWNPETNVDSVTQDGQMGAIQATQYLLNKGCKNIVWFGSDLNDSHHDDRLAGFLTTMYNAKDILKPENIICSSAIDLKSNAKKILKKKAQGIVALWFDFGLAIIEAADELGLKIGEDFELVSWCMQESLKLEAKAYLKNTALPMIIWSSKDLANSALSLLASKRTDIENTPVRIKIPTRLVLIDEKGNF
jgi:DNA-binding LacI/PurR family transcriptional regulator